MVFEVLFALQWNLVTYTRGELGKFSIVQNVYDSVKINSLSDTK